MRQLAKHFAVVPTPEYYTSKICSRCGSKCGPHPTLRRCVKRLHTDGSVSVQHREVRGLRVCQNEDCKLHLNRDRMGALNIATNYERLLNDEPLLRPLCQQDAELNSLQCALCPDF
jgi:transposase